MTDKQKHYAQDSDLIAHNFTPETFEPIYNTLIGLRFPMDVAQVLELRYLVNHAVDDFAEPALTPDYDDFREALQSAIDAFGIENKRHSDRLLKILAMMRELHYAYSIASRDAEKNLRRQMVRNRKARKRAAAYGLGLIFAAVIAGIIWVGVGQSTWPVPLITVGLLLAAWYSLRALPGLDKKLKTLEKDLHELVRRRVKAIHWKTLIQKLALLLGYKRIRGVEVFHIDGDTDYPGRSHLRH